MFKRIENFRNKCLAFFQGADRTVLVKGVMLRLL